MARQLLNAAYAWLVQGMTEQQRAQLDGELEFDPERERAPLPKNVGLDELAAMMDKKELA